MGKGQGKPALTAMLKPELEALCRQAGVKPLHAARLQAEVFRYGRSNLTQIGGLPQGFATWLMQHTSLPQAECLNEQRAEDGTRKLLLRLPAGDEVESVLIPAAGRVTQCISTQVGCAMGCGFCLTASMGLKRHLHASEMMAQFRLGRELLGAYPRNVVLMGMGEPLHNYEQVSRFVRLLTDPAGVALSPRRLTLSTSGLEPAIRRMTREALPCNLALSLNASNDAVRNQIMPVNRKYPLASLLAAVREFAAQGRRRRVLIEYVLMDGINDAEQHARELVSLLQDLPCTINLLPLNTHRGTPWRQSPPERVQAFWQVLSEAGFVTVVRAARGDDISAACGQLHHEQQCRSSVAA